MQIRRMHLKAMVFVALLLSAASSLFAADSKFLRFVRDDNGGATLQASTVRYANDDGVCVDLVAAVHIAEPSFYHAIDSSFADYDAVLFEMVAPKAMLRPLSPGSDLRKMEWYTRGDVKGDVKDDDDDEGSSRGGGLSLVSRLQMFLRDTLKLSFQLEQIDYKRSNFIHADLDAESFFELQGERNESFTTMMLNAMIHEMLNPDPAMMEDQVGLGDLLFALHSPDRARQLKLMFGREFGHIDEQMAGMEGPNGSVIVTERNKAALNALKSAMKIGRKNLAIFYGAAHLKGMDKTLTTEMGFHQVGPPFWRVAWDMTAPATPATKPTTQPRKH